MAKVFRCGDVMPECHCTAVLEGKDDAEVMAKVGEHAKSVHGMPGIPPEIAARVRAAIKDNKKRRSGWPKILKALVQYNDQVEGWFGLHPDVIVVGIFRDEGIFRPDTLARIARLTDGILRLPGVIVRDVVALPTVNDVTVADGTLEARPILERVPRDIESAERLREQVLGNPLLVNRLISADAKTTAIYVPIETSANGKVIADQIKAIAAAEGGPERTFFAGDPVARHTVGAEMFRQRKRFAPLAVGVLCVVLYLLFKRGWVVAGNVAVAVTAIVWAMGLFSGLGIPIHILASMGPIFMIAISTDTVHIFNEFIFRRREVNDRREAIHQTMEAVARPVLLSDLTTIAAFASLAIGPIIPARVFGLLVAFGTFVILLMSFTFVPALMALVPDRRSVSAASVEEPASSWLTRLGQACVAWKKTVVAVGVILVAVSAVGISKIRINNNLVAFFKPESEIRVADRHLSQGLGGTAPLYLVTDGKTPDAATQPEFLRALEELQRKLAQDPVVGKTVSVVDVVKRVHRVLNGDDPSREVIPDSQEEVAQYLLLFSMAARPQQLNNVVDYPYQKANLMVQLKSWDAVETRALLERIRSYLVSHPLPGGIAPKPAGMAYFNMVWSDEVLVGMLEGFIASSVLVLFLLILDYRSFRWGIIAFLPLLFTVVLIYGAVGFIGKDFDLPVSVLSTLSLGLTVDFAIHFVSRFQQRYRETRDRLSEQREREGEAPTALLAEGATQAPTTIDEPSQTIENIESAFRVFGNVRGWDLSFFAYRGFFHTPASQIEPGPQLRFFFPPLHVYGASAQGATGGGVLGLEAGYYDSRRDPSGRNPAVENSSIRLLTVYQREIIPDLTLFSQYYIQIMEDHAGFLKTLPSGMPRRPHARHVLTLRLTQLLLHQTLRWSLFVLGSPNERDLYVNPEVKYNVTDEMWIALGVNLFSGPRATEFGQFEENSNLYTCGALYLLKECPSMYACLTATTATCTCAAPQEIRTSAQKKIA